ncbi:MAG: ion channel [Gordonia sp. (in: high G+C Gram-positive bacteria)]
MTQRQWEAHTEWPMATVAVAFLAAYAVQVLARPTGATNHALDIVELASWAIFAIDYLVRLVLAEARLRWFVAHLFELAIIVLPVLRPLRLLRLVALVRVLQSAIGGAIRGRVIVYTLASSVILIFVAALAILDAERQSPQATVRTFPDAVWWAITTLTTVGYGDYSPTTITGKCIAVALMIGGIGLIGVVTGTLASWIVQQVAEDEAGQQVATQAQMAELLAEVHALRAAVETRQRTAVDSTDASDGAAPSA